MNYFEKRLLEGLDVSLKSVEYCNSIMRLNNEQLRAAIVVYYASDCSPEDFEEFNRQFMLSRYVVAERNGDEQSRQNAIRWLRGEYRSRRESNRDLGTPETIADADVFVYLRRR